MLSILKAAPLAAGIALALAVPASADPDSGFVQTMRAIGITGTDDQILANAAALCQDAAKIGVDGVHQVEILREANPTLSFDQAVAFVNTVNVDLCPASLSSYWESVTSMGSGGGGGGAGGG
jgi:hypothetical protein